MQNLAVLKLSGQLCRLSLALGERYGGNVRAASTKISKPAWQPSLESKLPKVEIPRSPFVKTPASYAKNRANSLTSNQHFFQPLLLPEYPEKKYQLRRTDYFRSFARKDISRKPRPKLETPPVKFAIKDFPEQYTTKPLKTVRTGGRHPETGQVIYRRIGGGVYRDHFLLDTTRTYIPADGTIEEKVLEIRPDAQRTGKIALIGHEDQQHWIIATEHMKVGQVIKSSRTVGRIAVRAFEGDTYAVGALPIGTVVSSLEVREGAGAVKARAAGCCAQILKKEEGSVIIQLPSKQTVKVADGCIATVGRVSNVNWNKFDWGYAGYTRRMGIRPKSGLHHKKDGYCGRKIHPAKPLRSYLVPVKPKIVEFAFGPQKRSVGLIHS